MPHCADACIRRLSIRVETGIQVKPDRLWVKLTCRLGDQYFNASSTVMAAVCALYTAHSPLSVRDQFGTEALPYCCLCVQLPLKTIGLQEYDHQTLAARNDVTLPLESQDLKRSLHRYLAPVVSPGTLKLEALCVEHTQDMHRRKSHRRAASDLTHPPSKAFSVIPGIASRADVAIISAR